jgi:hypothetical protein
MNPFRMRPSMMLAVLAVALSACGEQPFAPSAQRISPGTRPLLSAVPGEPAFVLLKKLGPVGTYRFEFSATTGTLPLGEAVSVNQGVWYKVWEATNLSEPDAPFSGIEVLSPTVKADSIYYLTLVRDADGFLQEGEGTMLRDTNEFTLTVGKDIGAYVTVFNSEVEIPSGGEGCTPGYWRQSNHYDSWPAPYSPATLFGSVFGDAFPNKTLGEIVTTGGGGLNALGRHAVAALLNSASSGVDYDLSTGAVVAQFNDAFASGDYEPTKDVFEGFNEQECLLN